MNDKKVISTEKAPGAIGTYSQAVRAGNTVYISGQIPLDPKTMEVVDDNFEAAAHQVMTRVILACRRAGRAGSLGVEGR